MPGGPDCSTAHDAPQTDAARTACLQAARAAQRPHCICAAYGSRPRPPRLLRLVPRLVPPRPAGRLHRTAPRPVRWRPPLNASRQLLIPGRRSEPGVFPSHLRVPPVRPGKHHPHHYARGKPSGQADQHPPPQAHPNPKRHIPTPDTGRVLYPSHDQPCQRVTAQPAIAQPAMA